MKEIGGKGMLDETELNLRASLREDFLVGRFPEGLLFSSEKC